MKFKKLFDNILFYISVPKCASCGIRIRKSDFCFCETCKKEYNNAKLTDCSKCAKLISECDCSTKYLKAHYIHKIFKVYRYVPNTELASNQIIYRLKRENRSDIREFLADELTESIRNKSIDLTNCMITNIPRRRSSVKKYGFDHTRELAKILSKKLGVPYAQILRSTSKHDQKKSKSREDRLSNASFEYKKKIPDIKGKTILLLDDIITTGASLSSAAMLIHGLGAKSIIGLSVAIAYKDDYTPFKFTFQ